MSPPVVLIVEDHVETRRIYAEFLSASYTVLQAGNGREALDIMQERAPALSPLPDLLARTADAALRARGNP